MKRTAQKSKFGATRCQIFRRKCTKLDFCWSSAPDPPASLQRSPDPLAVFKGSILLRGVGKGGEAKERGNKGKGKGREKEEREGEGPKRLISTAFADQISYP